jgi:hypothetical protein
MRWVTILVFLAPLAWTALSFVGYRDWGFALQSSLVAWVVSAVLWLVVRLTFRLSVAVVLIVVSLGIFLWGGQWLENSSRSGKEIYSLALKAASERLLGRDSPKPRTTDEAQRSLRTEKFPQKPEGLWSVQVGAFKAEHNAIEFATTLNNEGYDAYVIHGEVKTVNFYRTQVGRFGTRAEAEKLLTVLRDKHAYRAAFVARM